MAKAKKITQQTQQLSPINYIRQKARNLPIHECWINSDWKTHGEANIIVLRIHANGHYTFGVYLVDLYCLGTKDTFFNFNIDTDMYNKLLIKMGSNKFQKVSYVLVHNIIYAANEYALELGFKPHEKFSDITKYILEEDTDDIELIDIECGRDGKPFYISSVDDSPKRIQQIIDQLRKAVGKDGFNITVNKENLYSEGDNKEE